MQKKKKQQKCVIAWIRGPQFFFKHFRIASSYRQNIFCWVWMGSPTPFGWDSERLSARFVQVCRTCRRDSFWKKWIKTNIYIFLRGNFWVCCLVVVVCFFFFDWRGGLHKQKVFHSFIFLTWLDDATLDTCQTLFLFFFRGGEEGREGEDGRERQRESYIVPLPSPPKNNEALVFFFLLPLLIQFFFFFVFFFEC